MKVFIIATFIAIVGTSCDQKTADKKETGKIETPDTPIIKQTVITSAYMQIPGSQFYIIPPAGFKKNETTMQLKKDYANFMHMKIISGYTPETYFAGLKTTADTNFPGSWKQEDIIADGHKASIYKYRMPGVIQYYLAFTDGYSDDMIIANFEDTDTATGDLMHEALKTVVVQK